ncbi:NAD(P)/FAD-dependent oxidoreductase [Bifidobacterium tibiigranuli]|uniref:NAD(P)/FAD-dependent oxidoreductase n=1 Tax=Bifidobacterium tibiigranuli TaxID=2172043 RepID=UPI0026F0C72E|nr:NAD(P)/FAD-dependent oxidoreductase [Bifidobacterium tibiigranuli]MCI1649527.1 NAD(P)/FAD-dependent oxidoreductase [Bifidobacterium tibiigranuli]MCI2185013.1 NAD(P)/FAD-dependent oxidoreductase [Bifidobacterium tibiigranuli]MCI2203422.1 NAD(P)/FAD-dependent oxidoreductase [Bifidobacterium tibiigranuli]
MTTIAVLGAGYAGMRTVKRLVHEKVDARIVLINNNPYHYESTQLHEIAAGTKEPSDITFDIRDAVSDKVEVVIDTVERIDREHSQVILKEGEPLAYDYLVNALGFESETFGIPGAEENSVSFNNIDSALAVREHMEKTLANYTTSHDENDLHIVVCGAGFTGIELLGELAWRVPQLAKQYSLPEDLIRITCVEASPKILAMLPDNLSKWAVDYLISKGIEIHNGIVITEVRPGVVVTADQEFHANTIIWTTGVRGSHVICDSGYDQKRNRVVVEDDLSVKGHPNEFLVGDVSAVPDATSGRLYPTTAQISIAQADVVAANVAARLVGREPHKFIFKSLGTVCSLGPHTGVAELNVMGHWKLKGHKVSMVKRMVNDRSVFELAHLKEMLESN